MEEIRKDLQDIRESQIRMEADLKYHIKRTDILEARIEKHEIKVEQKLAPLPIKDKLQIGAFIATIAAFINQFLKQVGL